MQHITMVSINAEDDAEVLQHAVADLGTQCTVSHSVVKGDVSSKDMHGVQCLSQNLMLLITRDKEDQSELSTTLRTFFGLKLCRGASRASGTSFILGLREWSIEETSITANVIKSPQHL